MTGGLVVVLGPTGRNFGAGMSGGLAFVYDEDNTFEGRINSAMIGLERLSDEEETASLAQLISVHATLTGSPHAQELLKHWDETVKKLWKVVPHPPTPDTPKALYRFEEAAAPALA
jgi:glutamate synthase (NADPH/NADH) large chain/glutamate synthase (ferredoxin)